VRQAQRHRPLCQLCQGASVRIYAFIPTDQAAWGIAPGWQAGCVYGLCRRCAALPDRLALVEAALWRTRAHAVAPWN